MRNTIKAKVGYVIWFKKSNPDKVTVCDGDDVLFRGERRSWEDYTAVSWQQSAMSKKNRQTKCSKKLSSNLEK